MLDQIRIVKNAPELLPEAAAQGAQIGLIKLLGLGAADNNIDTVFEAGLPGLDKLLGAFEVFSRYQP